MSYLLEAITAAMRADSARMSVIGQNLSNASTPGYKAQQPVSWEHALARAELEAADPDVFAAGSLVSLRGGAYQKTEGGLDLAIEGEAYFQILTDAGVRYSKRGDFRLDAEGQLMAVGGGVVLGTQGAIRLPSDQVAIDAAGRIQHDGQIIGQLALAVFDPETRLLGDSDGLLIAAQPPVADTVQLEVRVKQGYLESSNVQPVVEMTRLMETVRHFGLNAQALRAYDQMLGIGISDLGTF